MKHANHTLRHVILASFTGACMSFVLITGLSAAVPLTADVSGGMPVTLSPQTIAAAPMWLGALLGCAVAFGWLIFSHLHRK